MTGENRRANIAAEVETARRARAVAGHDAAAGFYEAAANRLYYAAFHLVRAVCLTEGIEAKTHRGLKQVFVLHFVVPGAVPDWTATAVGRLETERDLADYAAGYRVTAEHYDTLRAEADRLVAELEGFLRRGGWLDR